jgi:hypothetical protein
LSQINIGKEWYSGERLIDGGACCWGWFSALFEFFWIRKKSVLLITLAVAEVAAVQKRNQVFLHSDQ